MRKVTEIQFQPVGEEKPAENIASQIRQKIISGEIEAGTRLPSERKMMEMFDRSRSTVREALRLLAQDGYVTTVSRSSGAIVTEPGVEQVADSLESIIQMQNLKMEDIMEFRRQTESFVASLAAARRSEEDLSLLETLLERMEQSRGEEEKFAELDFTFHMAIFKAAQNEVYVLMLHVCRQVIRERLTRTLRRGSGSEMAERYKEIIRIHRLIYEAIRDQNEDAAHRLTEEHLMRAEKDVLDEIFEESEGKKGAEMTKN